MNQMECLTKCLESLTKSLERYRLMKDVFADLVNYQLNKWPFLHLMEDFKCTCLKRQIESVPQAKQMYVVSKKLIWREGKNLTLAKIWEEFQLNSCRLSAVLPEF